MSNRATNDADAAKCICPQCPSFNICAQEKGEALYCAQERGASVCEYTQMGCLCGICPIHSEYGLRSVYYCVNGAESEE